MPELEGVDYSWARPGGAALKAAGKSFAMRYVPYQGDGGKGLKADELADLQANGIAVGLVFESTAGRMLEGYGAGVTDATVSLAAAAMLGFPKDRPIYFACDFDTIPVQLAMIDDYLRGAASVLGIERVGVYGEYDVVDHCLALGTARWFWQTYAWSGGRVHAAAHVLQYSNGQTVAGGEVDLCRSLAADFGQWGGAMVDTRVARLEATTFGNGFNDRTGKRLRGEEALSYAEENGFSLMLAIQQVRDQLGQLAFVVNAANNGADPAAVTKALLTVFEQYLKGVKDG